MVCRCGLKHSGLRHYGLEHSGLNHCGLRQTGLKIGGLKHSGLNYNGLKHSCLKHNGMKHDVCQFCGFNLYVPWRKLEWALVTPFKPSTSVKGIVYHQPDTSWLCVWLRFWLRMLS